MWIVRGGWWVMIWLSGVCFAPGPSPFIQCENSTISPELTREMRQSRLSGRSKITRLPSSPLTHFQSLRCKIIVIYRGHDWKYQFPRTASVASIVWSICHIQGRRLIDISSIHTNHTSRPHLFPSGGWFLGRKTWTWPEFNSYFPLIVFADPEIMSCWWYIKHRHRVQRLPAAENG